MSRLKELDAIRPELESWVVNTAEKMGESAICLTIFSEDYKKGMDSLLQFALAVMMDKPIYLTVPEGVKVPEHVKKIATAIEYYKPGDMDSLQAAATRLLNAASSRGFGA